jgi:hypothetical protein
MFTSQFSPKVGIDLNLHAEVHMPTNSNKNIFSDMLKDILSEVVEGKAENLWALSAHEISLLLAPVRVIAGHKNPHLDELVAIAIARRYLGLDKADLRFGGLSEADYADNSILKIGDGASHFADAESELVYDRFFATWAIIDEHLPNGRQRDMSAVKLVAELAVKAEKMPSRKQSRRHPVWAFVDAVHYGETHDRISSTTLQALVKSIWSMGQEVSEYELVNFLDYLLGQLEKGEVAFRRKSEKCPIKADRLATLEGLRRSRELAILVPKSPDAATITKAHLLRLAVAERWIDSACRNITIVPVDKRNVRDATSTGAILAVIGFDSIDGDAGGRLYSPASESVADWLIAIGLSRSEIGLSRFGEKWFPMWTGTRRGKDRTRAMSLDFVLTAALQTDDEHVTMSVSRLVGEMLDAATRWSRLYELACPAVVEEARQARKLREDNLAGGHKLVSLTANPEYTMLAAYLMQEAKASVVAQRSEAGNLQIFLNGDKLSVEEKADVSFCIFVRLVEAEMKNAKYAEEEIEEEIERLRCASADSNSIDSPKSGLYWAWGSMILNGSLSHPDVKPLSISSVLIDSAIRRAFATVFNTTSE